MPASDLNVHGIEKDDLEQQSLVVFSEQSTFYHGGATAQTLDREEGWEYFLFV